MRKMHLARMRQRGVSLIEIMVSLVIGLFVVGAVMLNYLGSGASGKQASQLAQMTEDAQIAFAQMSRDIQMAGYSDVSNILSTGLPGATATFVRALAIPSPLLGCQYGFVDTNASWNAAACTAGPVTVSHVIQVTYQTTTATNIQTAGGLPTDCLGNSVNGNPSAVKFTNNRYYVATSASGRPELHCASPAAPGAPIAENVESMKLWYGMATAWSPTNKASRQPVRYVTASDVAAGGGWGNVVAVRICLLMRTAEPVLVSEDPTAYLDCDAAAQNSADRRIYRAFFSTVAVRNKMGF
jgi:type IV pilus assembly protein PilW